MSKNLRFDVVIFSFAENLKSMNLSERKNTFSDLGISLRNISNCKSGLCTLKLNEFTSASETNEWFTKENITFALNSIAANLSEEDIDCWLKKYPNIGNTAKKRVGVVAAGNIPLVSFHDFISVLMAGHELTIKLSSKDDKLMKILVDLLFAINSDFRDLVFFENNQLKNFDAIIATGSDNTAKYFEYYFGKYPNIIRKNRNSIAVLTGDESEEELNGLAEDIMMYFGLGCRNVSKLFIPQGFDIQRVFKSLFEYKHFIDHNKYANNYTYNKSLYLMNKVPFWENGFAILTENTALASPISVVYFEYYNSLDNVKDRIDAERDKIQCVVSHSDKITDKVAFGQAQKPKLWDYADNVDTMSFLTQL